MSTVIRFLKSLPRKLSNAISGEEPESVDDEFWKEESEEEAKAREVPFLAILAFLRRVPGIREGIGCEMEDDGRWWLKFTIDIEHPLAWHVVQELGNVLNFLSWDERLPTVFKPVSPPSYLNGGPEECLSWVVECKLATFSPDECVEWLEGRLPRPVDDLSAWESDDE